MALYPLKFKQNFHATLWGGRRLRKFKGMIQQGEIIGESWEVSVVPNYVSEISNGEFQGKLLTDIIAENPEGLLGKRILEKYGQEFPLLIKFIDAEKNLSIQVHPDDKLAKQRHGCNGKTEMWYVIDSKEDTEIIVGLTEQLTEEEFSQKIKDLTIENCLAHYKTKKGDVFYLPAGRVHAIGAGSFILEIQENSDITYRIYDYDRIDINGRKRELHVEQAKQAIDYTVFDNYKTEIEYKDNESTTLVDCDHFFTAMIDLTAPRHIDIAKDNAFRIFVCIEGFVSITDSNNKKTLLKQGETVLVPAEIEFVELIPRANSKVVEITA
ncbi:MAG: class I mannose-6-phosphate isomerase [Paludibacteraceae bacterium]|nr:class I mannose-6-phosphate isomerase [Paludibacteraceae bacterium]